LTLPSPLRRERRRESPRDKKMRLRVCQTLSRPYVQKPGTFVTVSICTKRLAKPSYGCPDNSPAPKAFGAGLLSGARARQRRTKPSVPYERERKPCGTPENKIMMHAPISKPARLLICCGVVAT